MIDAAEQDICRYYGDTRSINGLGVVVPRNRAQVAVRAQAVAAQWELRNLAKGKPQHGRLAAISAIGYIKNIARGHAVPRTYAALAEKIEILKASRAP